MFNIILGRNCTKGYIIMTKKGKRNKNLNASLESKPNLPSHFLEKCTNLYEKAVL